MIFKGFHPKYLPATVIGIIVAAIGYFGFDLQEEPIRALVVFVGGFVGAIIGQSMIWHDNKWHPKEDEG